MDLYDIAIAKKLSSSGGGGGSSDFSTAEVTIINNTEDNIILENIINIEDDFLAIGIQVSSATGSKTAEVVLYQDLSTGYFIDASCDVVVTGNITYDSEYGDIRITGDGTITISPKLS